MKYFVNAGGDFLLSYANFVDMTVDLKFMQIRSLKCAVIEIQLSFLIGVNREDFCNILNIVLINLRRGSVWLLKLYA